MEGCQDAEKALTTFRGEPGHYDVVITDQTLPHMSGLKFSTQVHAIYQETPVILVSGYTAAISDERVRMAGVSAVLDKPYGQEILATARALFKPSFKPEDLKPVGQSDANTSTNGRLHITWKLGMSCGLL